MKCYKLHFKNVRNDGIHEVFMVELRRALEEATSFASSLGAIRVVFDIDAHLVIFFHE